MSQKEVKAALGVQEHRPYTYQRKFFVDEELSKALCEGMSPAELERSTNDVIYVGNSKAIEILLNHIENGNKN